MNITLLCSLSSISYFCCINDYISFYWWQFSLWLQFLKKKKISSSPYWKFRGLFFFVYEQYQYLNQHKLKDPESVPKESCAYPTVLFHSTELLACHHKNYINTWIAGFRKAFLFWLKAHKSLRVSNNWLGGLVYPGYQYRSESSHENWYY